MTLLVEFKKAKNGKSIRLDCSDILAVEEDTVTVDNVEKTATKITTKSGVPGVSGTGNGRYSPKGGWLETFFVQESPEVVSSRVEAASLEFEVRKAQIIAQMTRQI
jgi:hypothetical protein